MSRAKAEWQRRKNLTSVFVSQAGQQGERKKRREKKEKVRRMEILASVRDRWR